MQPTAARPAAEAAARILSALRSQDVRRLDAELERVSGLCVAPGADSWAEEQAELLDGVVSEIRVRRAQGGPLRPLEPQTSLLSHLAGCGGS
jgi:hypothetical protein